MCSTNKTLNLLKILIREVEFYLQKKSMGIQLLEPTCKSWFMSTTMKICTNKTTMEIY
jgi:hypothetical protein